TAVALTIFNGCQKDELGVSQQADNVQLQEVVQPDVYSNDGFLVFSNQTKLSETLNSLMQMSEIERRTWENKHNFKSQLSIFHDIVDAEIKLDEPYEDMSEEELRNAIPPPEHSVLYYEYLDKCIINEIQLSDGTKIYDYSTCAPYLAAILDENGIFAVGDTMYQFTARTTKKWIGCNIDNKEKLISTEENNDEIEVKYDLKSTTVKYGSWQYDSGGKRRLRIGINFDSYQYYANGTVWNYEHWVEVQSQKKNFWGNWKYNTTNMYITGVWDYSISYGNQYYIEGEFLNTTGFYDYPNPRFISASNYKSTCSISTGTIYPYGSIMSIMTDGTRDTGSFNQEDLKVIFDVELTDFYWEVTGHSYVTASVSY
ncbi:MAG: hypothetical protein ACOCUL_02505, partial [Bacteroidota bacterium]